MNDLEKLHTAIRRHCLERYSYWIENHNRLQAAGMAFSPENGYTDKAFATFPRYLVLDAILTEIELYQPADFSSLDDARDFFCLAAREAQSALTKPPNHEISEKVMNEERELICDYINQLTEMDLAEVEPLPSRRVLSAAESQTIREKLAANWNAVGYWYPLQTEKRNDAEAFESNYFEEEFGFDRLREILRRHNVKNVWEIREDDINYELELDGLEPHYSGLEGFWCSEGLDWLIYASHESSLTIAGSILPDVKNLWENWEDRLWANVYCE